MKRYKIVFILNGKYKFVDFSYFDENEKQLKLNQWKQEFLNPYNTVQIILYGESEYYKKG